MLDVLILASYRLPLFSYQTLPLSMKYFQWHSFKKIMNESELVSI